MESWSDKQNVTQESLASISAAREVLEASRLQIEASRALIKRGRERLQQQQIDSPGSPTSRLNPG